MAGPKTAAALETYGGTILLADSHTLKALEEEEAPASSGHQQGPSSFVAPPSLRGGFVKVGSGEALGAAPPREWSGVPLTTVGKPK